MGQRRFMPRIFDDSERTDPSPADDMESSYHFLTRVARPQRALVRELIEDWFSEYPAVAQVDMRGRLQNDDYAQHIGAWWELYTYKLFRCLDYRVAIHPLVVSLGAPPLLVLRLTVALLAVDRWSRNPRSGCSARYLRRLRFAAASETWGAKHATSGVGQCCHADRTGGVQSVRNAKGSTGQNW
jgi:hypothetical protein